MVCSFVGFEQVNTGCDIRCSIDVPILITVAWLILKLKRKEGSRQIEDLPLSHENVIQKGSVLKLH